MTVDMLAKPARTRIDSSGPSTSIRVLAATRDVFAEEAAAQGLSLAGYLDRLACRTIRERALDELREERAAAFQDPVFLAEMKEWDEADDSVVNDDGWPEYNAAA